MLIYNSLTKKKEEFLTVEPKKATLYICGVTPYDEPHLGHAITALRGNIFRRYLQYAGYEVTYVQNITDIDDKIITRSRAEKVPFGTITERYIESYQRQLKRFGITPPDSEPRATEYIEKITQFVQQLIDKGRAYVAGDGDVYFDVAKDPDYGCLSRQEYTENVAGSRKGIRSDKRSPHDFALWKRFDEESESFPSPWGRGRPGWHIECSVMSTDILGSEIDIHLGGLDLIFPHHENELAQCRGQNKGRFVRYWAHLGLLNINGSKMSKSLGNFLTVDQALDRYGKTLLIYSSLTFHYRSPINLSDTLFDEHVNTVLEWYRLLEISSQTVDLVESQTALVAAFHRAMDDDFNTSQALVVLSQGFKELRKLVVGSSTEAGTLASELRKLGKVLMLFGEGETYNTILDEVLSFRCQQLGLTPIQRSELEEMYKARQAAREKKDFVAADAIRDRLAPYKIQILDKSEQRFRF
jgi:cysteinyl-tRNA synthetase